MKLRIKYIQHWVDKKSGEVYAYFRKPGSPRLRLPGTLGSPEFWAGYHAALKGEEPAAAIATAKKVAASIEGAVARYIAEALPARVPSPSTRARQTSTLNTFAKKFGTSPVTNIDTTFIKNQIRTAPTVGVGRTWLITVRELCKWAVEEKLIGADPTAGIVIKLPKSEGHETWTEKQIAQFEARWPIGTRERLLFALLLHTGQRCSDVRLLGPTSIVNGAFPIKQQKTGAEVTIPVTPELRAAIDACKVVGLGFFLTAKTGKPLDQRDLNKWFREACDAAGLPDTCVPHGLRKAMCRRLAQKGASAHLIKAVSGHKTLKEVVRYTEAFDNVQGARDAFALLTNAGEAAE